MENNNEFQTIDKFLQVIRDYRVKRGISSEAIGYELGLSTSAYNKIERQESKLTLDRFLKIIEILEIPTKEFFSNPERNVINQKIEENNGVGYQQIESLYQENKQTVDKLLESKDQTIITLKEEIEFLKQLIKG